uniref:Uncharacterized protein n=1 Tax=Knipowitschia caucasica TaxID=637954 RepID=A0AAV2LMP6_KNICA
MEILGGGGVVNGEMKGCVVVCRGFLGWFGGEFGIWVGVGVCGWGVGGLKNVFWLGEGCVGGCECLRNLDLFGFGGVCWGGVVFLVGFEVGVGGLVLGLEGVVGKRVGWNVIWVGVVVGWVGFGGVWGCGMGGVGGIWGVGGGGVLLWVGGCGWWLFLGSEGGGVGWVW